MNWAGFRHSGESRNPGKRREAQASSLWVRDEGAIGIDNSK